MSGRRYAVDRPVALGRSLQCNQAPASARRRTGGNAKNPAQSDIIDDIRARTMSVAAAILSGWRWERPATWPLVRTFTVRVIYRAFATTLGMRVGDIAGELPPLRGLDELEVIRAACSLPYQSMTAEHFGAVHETLSGYTVNGDAIVETDGRRKGGVHFTPRSLTEPIVRRTIEPILDALQPQKTVLDLRICDPACGAGAFLLEVVRQLGAIAFSFGLAANETMAKRLAAIHCAYGVDICPHAVDSCKLALNLECLADGMPADWLDDNIKCGDALVGLASRKQVVGFTWRPDGEPAGVELIDASEKATLGPLYDHAIAFGVEARKVRIERLSALARQP